MFTYMTNDSFKTRNTQTSKEIDISIIIPSHNKFPLNMFTLYSLEKQHFDLSKVEVFLLDDASTDQTPTLLNNYHPAFHFYYIRCEKNIGRAKIRNLGIQHAIGKIIIFLDAEMYVKPTFIRNHFFYHQHKDNLIVTGAMRCKALYSCIYPSFQPEQLHDIKEIIKEDSELSLRFSQWLNTLTEAYPLLTFQDFDNGDFEIVSFEKSSWFTLIPEQYGPELEGFSFPWMAFLTGNVSLRKNLLDKVGGFDEEFVLYGYEDWELGYRLFHSGAVYIASDKVSSFHQEHPISSDKWHEAIENYYLFLTKHPDIDVLFLGIELSQLASLIEMNDILIEYRSLLENHLEEYLVFNTLFIQILVTIVLLLKIDCMHINILGAAGFTEKQRNDLIQELSKLKKLNSYNKLAAFIGKIISS